MKLNRCRVLLLVLASYLTFAASALASDFKAQSHAYVKMPNLTGLELHLLLTKKFGGYQAYRANSSSSFATPALYFYADGLSKTQRPYFVDLQKAKPLVTRSNLKVVTYKEARSLYRAAGRSGRELQQELRKIDSTLPAQFGDDYKLDPETVRQAFHSTFEIVTYHRKTRSSYVGRPALYMFCYRQYHCPERSKSALFQSARLFADRRRQGKARVREVVSYLYPQLTVTELVKLAEEHIDGFKS